MEEKESPYAAYAYDAAWVYAKALDKYVAEEQLDSIHEETKMEKFMELLSQVTFNGVSGFLKFKKASSKSKKGESKVSTSNELKNDDDPEESLPDSSESSDRENTFVYLQQNLVGVKESWFKKVGIFKKSGLTMYNKTNIPATADLHRFGEIAWPDGKGPILDMLEEAKCDVYPLNEWLGFDGKDAECPKTKAFLNVFGGIIGFLLIAVIFFTFHKKLKRMKENANRINGLGILGTGHPCLQLDDWEIPRENIVINRKLGEGAFGE